MRLQLFYFFDKPHTIKEAAEALSLKQANLYYHLQILKDVGLIEVVEEKKVRNMTMRYYQSIKEVKFDRHKMAGPGPKAPFYEILKGVASATYEDCLRTFATAKDRKAFGYRFFIKIKKESREHLPKEIAQASKEFAEKLKLMEEEDGDISYSVTILEFEMPD